MSVIDWGAQWALFAPHFKEGQAHIDLGEFGILPLAPGAGFGDFSHPTTRLMIQLMKGRMQNKRILDIGCGSGILSLAAIKMGAKQVMGVDIDDDAIAHAKENARLNHMNIQFSKKPRGTFDIILINMIESEQKVAWSFCSQFISPPQQIIASGILHSHRNQYISLASSWGWTLISETQEADWSVFLFQTCS
jgi:ribosomal protein L11 methyltransferase